MKNNHRVGLFLFFLSCGLLVFVGFKSLLSDL